MAGGAGLGCAEKRACQILDLDDGACRRGNALGGVAFVAGHALMFPFENIARKIVVEGLGIPFDQGKVFAIVLGVALGTGVVISLGQFVSGMEALARAKAACDLRMATQTLERGRGTKFVAVRAVQCPIQRFVCAGKRAGRNLRDGGFRKAQECTENRERGQGAK